MLSFIVKRLLAAVLVLWAMSVLVFGAVFAAGDPVLMMSGPDATQTDIAATRHALGLDQSLSEQYLHFVGGALHGRFGRSYAYSTNALALIGERLPATFELATVALIIAAVIGFPLGLYAGVRPRSFGARLVMGGSVLGFSLPSFWVGLMLIMLFAVVLGWLPTSGRGATVAVLGVPLSVLTLDGWRHLILPSTNLALFNIALVIRLARSGTQDALAQDYVRLARAKGASPARVLLVHVLRNIMIPIVTVLGLEFGSVLAFSIVTETVFAWPGMGKLLIDSINALDRPVIVAYLMVVVAIFVLINLMVDLLYLALDPRVQTGARR